MLQRIEGRAHKVYECLRSNAQLKAADSGRDVDGVPQQGALMDECGKRFFHADRRAAATDIARKGQKLLHMYHGAALVAGDTRSNLQVHFHGAGDYAHKQPATVSAENKSLEHAVKVLSQFLRYMRSLKVLFINFIWHKGILNPRSVKKPRGICFLHIHTTNLRKKTYLSKI